jgi:hypothetical protein
MVMKEIVMWITGGAGKPGTKRRKARALPGLIY